MTELRQRFIKDLQLKGYSVRTQDLYDPSRPPTCRTL